MQQQRILITMKEAALIARALETYEDQHEGLFAHGEPQLLHSIRSKIEKGKSGIAGNPTECSEMLPDLNGPTV